MEEMNWKVNNEDDHFSCSFLLSVIFPDFLCKESLDGVAGLKEVSMKRVVKRVADITKLYTIKYSDQATPQLSYATPQLSYATPQLIYATPQLSYATPQLSTPHPS